jgi:N-acetyl sugar amidotransferase
MNSLASSKHQESSKQQENNDFSETIYVSPVLVDPSYKSCSRCIYNEKIPYITFDDKGICNYCHQFDQLEKEYVTGEAGMKILRDLASKIKEGASKRDYDVVVGVSGGTDSSYLVYLAKELGLRPLAAHFDNTWNSQIAVENIQNVLSKLNVDLYTHVVDNREFNDIFRSFIKASVPDIDTASDIGLATTHYLAAKKHGIKYIFEGHSFRTEGISPHGWFYMDAQYIRTVHKLFGSMKMSTFPNLDLLKWLKWSGIDKIRKVRPLYFVDYNKEKTKNFLAENFGWKWYGGHHMENRTAYFTNNYYLPKKFQIDLRFSELSALVRNGQITRDEAIKRINEPKPFDSSILSEVKKRLSFSDEEFEAIMNSPKKSFRDYKTFKKTFERLRWLFWIMYKCDMVPKSFYLKYTQKYSE